MVTVKLEGDGLSYEKETTVYNAAQIIGFLQSTEDDMTPTANPVVRQPALAVVKPKLSPREALTASGAKTNPQKITVLGSYVMDKNSSETFKLDEVRNEFKRAGEPLPRNFNRDAKDAIEMSYIYMEGDDGDFTLTDTAREYVVSGFPEAVIRKKASRRANGKSSKHISKLNDELLKLLNENGGSLRDFIKNRSEAYQKRASNQTAILAVWLADELQLDGVSAGDLHAVRRYLGEPAGNVNAQLNNAMSRDGFFSHAKDGRYYLSGKGDDFGRHLSLDEA